MVTKQPTTKKEVSRYITIIRPEFMTFCHDACRSATLNHLLFRIAWKCKNQPKEKIQGGDILWYAKTELITGEMSDAWGVCKVRKEVNELLRMNLIGKKSNPTWGADRTKHFFFGSEQCQVFVDLCEKNNICIVHLGLPAEVVHLIYSSNANDKSIKCSCSEAEKTAANDKSIDCKRYNHQMETIDLSNANDKSIEAITEESIQKIYNKDSYEEESTIPRVEQTDDSGSAFATPTHALVSHPEHDFIWFDNLMAPTLMVVRYTQAFPGPMFSEYEDKRRSRKADEIRSFFEGRGINVRVRYEHETGDETTVEAPHTPSSSQSEQNAWAAYEQVKPQFAEVSRMLSQSQGEPDGNSNSHGIANSGGDHSLRGTLSNPGGTQRDPGQDAAQVAQAAPQTSSASIVLKVASVEDRTASENVYTNSQLPDGGVYSAGAPAQQLSTVAASSPQSAKVEPAARSQSKKGKPAETAAPPAAPTMPPADAEWKTTTCLLMFTYWRTKPLIGTYKNSQASTCAKGLALNYTREQVEKVRAYMVEDDPYWSQEPERVDVCQVSAHIHEILAKIARGKGKVKKTPKDDLYSPARIAAEQSAEWKRNHPDDEEWEDD